VGLGVIGHLVADTGGEDELASVDQLGFKATFQAEQDVAFLAPMVGDIAGGVLDHADADVPKLACPPECFAPNAGVFTGFDLIPICYTKWDVCDVHVYVPFQSMVVDEQRLFPIITRMGRERHPNGLGGRRGRMPGQCMNFRTH